MQLAIGQKDLTVTPLQMARFYAMIANGGKLVRPHLLDQVEEPGTQPYRPARPPPLLGAAAGRRRIDPSMLAPSRPGLYGATHGSQGTASAVF